MKDSGKQYSYDMKQKEDMKKSINVGQMVSVMKFYPESMTVDVQPLSQERINGKYSNKSPILGVPCVPFGFGRFIVRPWFEPGDVGYIGHIDHDIDYVMIKGQITKPNTTRNHADEDCVFLGGLKVDTVDMPKNIPKESFVICTKSGSVYMSFQDNLIEIVGDIDIKGNIKIVGNIDIIGDVNLVGKISQEGGITLDGDISLSGNYKQEGDLSIVGSYTQKGNFEMKGDMEVKGNISAVEYLFIKKEPEEEEPKSPEEPPSKE